MRLWVLLLILSCLAPRPARAGGAFPSWVKAPPRLGLERTERTHGYFGARSEEAQRVARSFVSARSRVTFVRRARLRTANPEVSDGLLEAVVLRVIRSRHGLLVACHANQALQPNPRVQLQLSIDAEGAATEIRATSKQSPALGTCVARRPAPHDLPQADPGPRERVGRAVFRYGLRRIALARGPKQALNFFGIGPPPAMLTQVNRQGGVRGITNHQSCVEHRERAVARPPPEPAQPHRRRDRRS